MASGVWRNSLSLLVMAALVAIFNPTAESASQKNPPDIRICRDKGHCVLAEIAATPESRMRGLMFRDVLPEDRGMLFIFTRSDYWGFWMKNTKIPLDIIWLDKSLRIVHVVRQAQPCISEPCRTYASTERALYVLELASGVSKKWDLDVGDKLIFKVPEGSDILSGKEGAD